MRVLLDFSEWVRVSFRSDRGLHKRIEGANDSADLRPWANSAEEVPASGFRLRATNNRRVVAETLHEVFRGMQFDGVPSLPRSSEPLK